MDMQVAGFMKTSAADGPGIRSVLFLQGCSRKCPGCHNLKYQAPGGGVSMELDAVVNLVVRECANRKLTIYGGEPLEQAEAVEMLVETLASQGFDLCLYTSFEEDEVPSQLKCHLTYLKTGPFIQKQRTSTTPFYGSLNQHFIALRPECH